MDEPLRELARRDAKAIRGGMVLTLAALVVGVVGLFTAPVVGGAAAIAALLVQLNTVAAWLAGPRWMAERRLVLAPGVVAGVPFALGAYALGGPAAAFVASLPAAALGTVVLGMTLAGRRS